MNCSHGWKKPQRISGYRTSRPWRENLHPCWENQVSQEVKGRSRYPPQNQEALTASHSRACSSSSLHIPSMILALSETAYTVSCLLHSLQDSGTKSCSRMAPGGFFSLVMTLMLLLLALNLGVVLAEGKVLSQWEWVITWTQAPKSAVLRRGPYRAGAEMGQ